MHALKLAVVALVTGLAVVLTACGSSGNNPPGSPLQITTQSPLPSGRVNTPYTTTFVATGGTPPYAWNASNLPPGLVMSPAGSLSGTPTQAGSFSPSVAVSDSAQGSANASFTISIADVLRVSTTTLPTDSPGLAYATGLMAAGGFPPYTWSVTQGSLPAGLTLQAATGLISGTATEPGTSNFTAQVSDSGMPPASASANLSISVNPPPARSAALYATDRTGAQIASDGSLSLLPSSPEQAINGSPLGLASSPTLPLIFLTTTNAGPPAVVESLFVNPDYSLNVFSISLALPDASCIYLPAVDPTGSNLYVSGCTGTNGETGILIYPANGSLLMSGSVSVPNLTAQDFRPARVTFTPDGTLAFVPTCANGGNGTIVSYSRATSGLLTQAATYTLPSDACPEGVMVSPDGRYLAEWEFGPAIVQVFSIGSDGTLTSASQRLTIMQGMGVQPANLFDMVWDNSGSYLIGALNLRSIFGGGGLAVLQFSGSSLTQVGSNLVGVPADRIVRDNSYLYLEYCASGPCGGLTGYDFQNGQLTPLPGSPYPFGAREFVIY